MALQTKLRVEQENFIPASRAPAPETRKSDCRPRLTSVPTGNCKAAPQAVPLGAAAGRALSGAQADQALVARVQAGDKQAFNVLAQKYQQKLFKLVSRYVHDQTEALDVVQEAFIKAYRA